MPRASVLALAAIAALTCSAAAQQYDFTIKPGPSGLDGPLTFAAQTAGTLIGNYDELNNPTGTRTKPGIFGTFGSTENVAIPVTVGLGINRNLNTSTSGAFRLTLDQGTGGLVMQNFASNFLHSGPVQLPITMSLLYQSFRTRAPSSTYIGGVPLNVPLGEATLTQFSAVQVGPGVGSITQTGPNTFSFSIAPIVEITAAFEVLGNPFLIPGAPAALALSGEIVLSGNTATLTSVQPIGFTSQLEPNFALPQLPLDLPTVLPPGETAHLLMDLTLQTINAGFDGTLNLTANGVLVPAPGAAPVLAFAWLLSARRRRSQRPAS
jgi:hypothetical protein